MAAAAVVDLADQEVVVADQVAAAPVDQVAVVAAAECRGPRAR